MKLIEFELITNEANENIEKLKLDFLDMDWLDLKHWTLKWDCTWKLELDLKLRESGLISLQMQQTKQTRMSENWNEIENETLNVEMGLDLTTGIEFEVDWIKKKIKQAKKNLLYI